MNDEIREAVEALNTLTRSRMAGRKTLQPLVDLATAYLSIEGMPEEKKIHNDYSLLRTEKGNIDFIRENELHSQFNSALHLCKLAMLKKCEGLEEVIARFTQDSVDPEDGNALATAVRNHLLGGGK